MKNTILFGDVLGRLKEIPDGSVQCVVTSPPYFGLRDYGVKGQIGLEDTPEAFVGRLVEVFQEIRRALRDDGTVWLNLGDSYAGSGKGQSSIGANDPKNNKTKGMKVGSGKKYGLKAKDLIGIPWRVAFALQSDGWYLRQDIIWHKPNTMPESVRDRCTKAHEYVFMLTKRPKYYYDADAISEPTVQNSDVEYRRSLRRKNSESYTLKKPYKWNFPKSFRDDGKRNCRTVWNLPTKPYKEAHFATFPEALPERCILAGTKRGDLVLDPFVGSGTTCAVAKSLGRRWIGIELNPEYVELAKRRIAQKQEPIL